MGGNGSMGGNGPMGGGGPMGGNSMMTTGSMGGNNMGGGASGPRGGYGNNMGGGGGRNGMKEEYGSTPSYDTVVIRNLPLDCNWQVLREGFSNCGNIKFVEMKERGTGIIRFESPRDAE